jgi:hypothetical protein
MSLAGLLAGALMALALASASSGPTTTGAAEAEARDAYGKLPLSFIPNRGQTDERVRYYAQVPGLGFYLTDDKAVLSLTKGERGTALEMRFVGANRDARLEAGRPAPETVNYLNGSQHQTDLPTYGQVTYRELWPGIDMVFRGRGGKLKYEFHVAPGADPSRIRLAYAGADGLSLGAAGNLLIATPLGTLRDSRPVSYQRIAGERLPVASRYALEGASTYGFAVGAHDSGRRLVIDPGLDYSTYLGGSLADTGLGIAVDSSGSAYVTGNTASTTDFPTTPGAFQTTHGGGSQDAFVTKVNPSGSALVYSTYLGGTGREDGYAIAVDASGSAYVTGFTESSNFPTTAGALDTSINGSNDAFVTKLSPTGTALVYSTYLGGTGDRDEARAIVVQGDSAYVTGSTWSTDFPITAGAFDTTNSDDPTQNTFWRGDVFVTKLNAGGSALDYSTYVGGTASDIGKGIVLDGSSNAYVTGSTGSTNYPTTPGAFDTSKNGQERSPDVFVTKLNATGSALGYSTFLGTLGGEEGTAIALDASGSAYVTGATRQPTFPTTAGAFDRSYNDDPSDPWYPTADAFVTKLNVSGSALAYSTFLGGEFVDLGYGIAVDASGRAHVTGYTESRNFPTTVGAFDTIERIADGFVTVLTPTGSGLAYSTYLGGSLTEQGNAIALGPGGSALVTGETLSGNYPTTVGAFRPSPNPNVSNGDAFVTKLSLEREGYVRPKSATPLEMTLVPAYAQCASPNRTHGPPLAFDSCNPPTQASDELTLGTPDTNAKPVRGDGMVQYAALGGNQADVRITAVVHDVYDQQTQADYTGEVRAHVGLRITDKINEPGDIATVSDATFGVTVPCADNPDPNQGATCNLVTSANAVAPGAVWGNRRAVWELGQVRVDDGGADGDADTPADNTLFMVQGVFVP